MKDEILSESSPADREHYRHRQEGLGISLGALPEEGRRHRRRRDLHHGAAVRVRRARL